MRSNIPVWLEVYSFLDENIILGEFIDVRFILTNIGLSPTSVYKGLHILDELDVINLNKVGVSYEVVPTQRFLDVKETFRDLLEAIK